MIRLEIDLIDNKLHLTSWPRKLSLNAEEALRVYEVIGSWLGLNRPVTGPWVDDYDQERLAQEEPYSNNEWIAGAG